MREKLSEEFCISVEQAGYYACLLYTSDAADECCGV